LRQLGSCLVDELGSEEARNTCMALLPLLGSTAKAIPFISEMLFVFVIYWANLFGDMYSSC
jgi:hypothetical protein